MPSTKVYPESVYQDWSSYFVFLLLMIPAKIVLDSFNTYLIDFSFSYNILDYLRFCAYRFSNRKEDMLVGTQVLDISL